MIKHYKDAAIFALATNYSNKYRQFSSFETKIRNAVDPDIAAIVDRKDVGCFTYWLENYCWEHFQKYGKPFQIKSAT